MQRFIPSQPQTRNEGNKDTFSHESARKADLASTIFQRILENVFPNVKESRKKDVGWRGVRRERENINFLFRLVSHSQGTS